MSQDTRKDRRAKIVSLNVRYKSATVDEFIENHSHDVSKGGLFIKTPTPFPPGTLLKFEIRIASDKAVIAGVGRVVWKREPTQAGNERPAGMGVKFIKVDDSSRATIDRVVGTGGAAGGSNFESEPVEEKPSIPVSTTAGPSKPPLVRRATMAGLGVGSIPPESLSASHPPAATTITSSGAPAGPPAPGTAAAAAALKAMPTVPRPMFPGQLQSLLHEEPVKEPTMMKQAAELLEEALKEAGGSMADIGDNPLFNRPSRRPPRPGSVAPTAASAATNNAPTTPPPPGIEDALSATKTLADEPAVPSRRAGVITTTAIGLPPPPGLRLGGSSPPAATSGITPPTPPTPPSPAADEAPVPKSTRSTAPPPLPAVAPDTAPELLVSESDIAALPSDSKVPALRIPTPVLPVSARAQLGSRGDAERRSGGGGLIWAGLGVVVVFGLFGVYKMGFFGGGEPPAPSAIPADTSAPSASAATSATGAMSAAPSASTSASASSSASGGASAMPSATSTTSAAPTATSTAAAATAAATTAAPAHTTAIPVFHKRPKPTPAEDDTTPDTPAATATSAATSTSTAAIATSTATATPTTTSTATSAPTATSTSTAAPTTTSTVAPTTTSTSTAAPTATMRRTIGTAAPTATATDTP